MSNVEPSFLTDIAKAEQEETEKTEVLADACRKRVDETRQHCQAELAALPTEIQETRRKALAAAKGRADKEVDILKRGAEGEEEQMDQVVRTMDQQIYDLVLSRILPGGKPMNGTGEAQ